MTATVMTSLAPWAAALGATMLGGISALHFAWASGVRWGIDAALPSVDGRAAFTPSRAMTVAVACVFGGAGALLVLATRTQLRATAWLCAAGAVVCALRAIGDFRLVGWSKRQRGSAFAYWDDRLFTPLAATLALCFAIVSAGVWS